MPGHKNKTDGTKHSPSKGMLLIKSLASLPGATLSNRKEKKMSAAYKMHGGKVHYKPGGGMVMDDMNKVMMKMHGGKVHDAKYYQKGAKVAGCGPARNKPNMTKKA